MRWILAVSVGIVFALQSAAIGQEAEKFVGTWFAPKINSGIDQSMTITHDGGAWEIRSTYSKAGKNVGSSVGTGVKLAEGRLLFVSMYVEKPVKSWAGSKSVLALRFQGNDLEMIDTEMNDKHVRTFKRTSSEPKVVAKVEPKLEPKVEPKVETKSELKVEPKDVAKVEPKPQVGRGRPGPKQGSPTPSPSRRTGRQDASRRRSRISSASRVRSGSRRRLSSGRCR